MKTRILVEVEVPDGTFTYRSGKPAFVASEDVLEDVRGGVRFRFCGSGNDWTRLAKPKVEVLHEDQNPR